MSSNVEYQRSWHRKQEDSAVKAQDLSSIYTGIWTVEEGFYGGFDVCQYKNGAVPPKNALAYYEAGKAVKYE
jgi:hypothetical protein